MPISTTKWQRQCARRSTEQRAQDKARLLGKPAATKPTKNRNVTAVNTGMFHGPRVVRTAGPVIINGQFVAEGAILTAGSYEQIHHIDYRTVTNNFTPILIGDPVWTTPEFRYIPDPGVMMPISADSQFAWNQWQGSATFTLTAPYSVPNQIWNTWNTYGGAVGGTGGAVGGTGGSVGSYGGGGGAYAPHPVEITAEQRAAQELATAERQRVAAKAREEQAAADERALQLFLHTLKPDERQTYEREKCIYIRGSRGRRYRIRCGTSQSHNVEWLDDQGNRLATLCAHPRDRVPNPDCWMVQKLTLEHDEDHFTSTCNYNGQRPADLVRV